MREISLADDDPRNSDRDNPEVPLLRDAIISARIGHEIPQAAYRVVGGVGSGGSVAGGVVGEKLFDRIPGHFRSTGHMGRRVL